MKKPRTDADAWRELDDKMRCRVMRLLSPKRPIGCMYKETPYTEALHLAQAVLHFVAHPPKGRR